MRCLKRRFKYASWEQRAKEINVEQEWNGYENKRNIDAYFIVAVEIWNRNSWKRGAAVCGLSGKGGADILADSSGLSDKLRRFAVAVVFQFCGKSFGSRVDAAVQGRAFDKERM